MKVGLSFFDLQYDYFLGGKFPLVEFESAPTNARLLFDTARRDHWAVFHVRRDNPSLRAPFPVNRKEGAKVRELLAPTRGEVCKTMRQVSCHRKTPLMGPVYEPRVGASLIRGAMCDMCVDAAIRPSANFGFSCIVANDARAMQDLAFEGRRMIAADLHASFMPALDAAHGSTKCTDKCLGDVEL